MGTRSSRLQEEAVASALEKDGIKRDSCRRLRAKRPTSLVVDFSGSFDQDSEINRSRSEEGSDSDQGQPVRADGSPGDLNSPSRPDQTAPLGESSDTGKPAEDSGSGNGRDGSSDRLAGEETSRVPHRTFSERLPSGRHTSGSRNGSGRAARARSAVARPVSEAWIGVSYRVSSRHATVRCPFCSRPFPGGRIEEHLLSCLTSPLPYNVDTLTKDSGECSICLEDLLQGETIARLACLCVYHKSCIDSWCKVKACCPEHPFE